MQKNGRGARIRRTFKRGSATMILGAFFLLACFSFFMMFAESYLMRSNRMDAQAAADAIADGTAQYALMNRSASYGDVSAKADEIAGVIRDETGIDAGSVTVDRAAYEDERTAEVSTSSEFGYLTSAFYPSGDTYAIRITSATRFGSGYAQDLSGIVWTNGTRTGCREVVELAYGFVGQGGSLFWDYFGMKDSWCAMFVSYCMRSCPQTASWFPWKEAYCPSLMMDFMLAGRWAEPGFGELVPGDVIFFDYYNAGEPHHVAIVVSVSGGIITYIGGNQGGEGYLKNIVSTRTISESDSRIFGFGLMNSDGGTGWDSVGQDADEGAQG